MEYSKNQRAALLLLRWAIGWHFLYEGGVKILNPAWTSKSYLLDSGGLFKPVFVALAQNQTLLQMADMANAWGLTLIGLSLLLGLLTRVSAVAGIILLLFYYLSHPAFPGIESIFPSDGSYFIVNKTLVEMVALWVVFAFPTSQLIGLSRFFKKTDLS